MTGANTLLNAVSGQERAAIEAWLLDFDRNWTENRLAVQLSTMPEGVQPYREVALRELVAVDLDRRWRSGRGQRLEDYLAAYPALGTDETIPPELIVGEIEARRACGPVDIEEYSERFPAQKEAVRRLLERVAAETSISGQAAETTRIPKTRVEPAVSVSAGAAPPGPSTPAGASTLPQQLGRYRILRKLGEGSMGAVYLAHDTQLDRQVAVKTPRFSGSDAAEMVERFYREARAAASFRHPNICPVHDASEIDGQHCLVMAYIDGHPLSRYIAGGKPQNERAVATTVRKLALALDQAHQRGVVHRDLKPANVMVDRQGEPLVMDFGLARRFRGDEETRITQTGFLLGTPAYMSPEQIEGDQEKIGPATDIYSLGVILYEVLTGKLPFSGSIGPLLRKIATEEPPDAAAARPGLDSRLASICRRMMAKKREERPASMRAVADELGEFLKSLRTDGGARKKHSATSDQQAESNECLALNRLLDDIAIDRLPASSAGHRTPPDRRKLILLGGGAGALLVLAGIIITIVNRNGTKTRVEAPDAESITISHTPEGTAAVRPGGEKESGASVETEDRVIADAPPPVGNSPEEAIRPLARLSGHAMRVTAVAYSADGRHFFSTGGTSDPLKIEFFVWDATTRQVDWSEVLEAGKAHRIVPFSDGRHVLIGGELGADASQPSLHVLDLETRKLVEPMNVGHPSGQAFDATSDGRLVLYRSGDRNLVLWDRMENREAKRYSLDELKVEGTPYLVMLSPDGKYAVLHSRGKAWHVVMLDLQTGTITSRYRGRNLQWNSLCWSRDSARILMSGAFGNIAVWEAESGQVHSQLRVPEVKDAGASTALFLPDERYVVLGQREGRVRLLDLKEGREVAFATAPPGTTTWLALSPDGRLAVTAEGFVRSQHKAEEKPTDNALRIWQLPVTAEPPSSKRE